MASSAKIGKSVRLIKRLKKKATMSPVKTNIEILYHLPLI